MSYIKHIVHVLSTWLDRIHAAVERKRWYLQTHPSMELRLTTKDSMSVLYVSANS